jgi:hypothetical protein
MDRYYASLAGTVYPEEEALSKENAACKARFELRFVGVATCGSVGCHVGEFLAWVCKPHAGAYAALERKGRQFDRECIGCHAIAYRERGGFFLPRDVGPLAAVSCEACHGPMSHHGTRKPPKPSSVITLATCTRCRTQERSPVWSDIWR